jgi:DNA end-binding protein Ku
MAARTIWKGYLKLSLVSCAIGVYPTTNSSSKIRFNTLNRDTGNRVKRQFVDAETGDVVENEDQVKGYQVGKGQFIIVEEAELDALRLESTHTIDIERFVKRDEVDERFLDTAYYLSPDDKVAQEAFAVIRDAIREKGMAGLGRVVMFRRERMMLIEPHEDGLLGTTLHARNEIRSATEAFESVEKVNYPREMLSLAEHIIDQKTGDFDPTMFDDRYEEAVAKLVAAKQQGRELSEPRSSQPSNVVNLMDALKRSISSEEPDSPKTSKPATARKRPAARSAAKKTSRSPTRTRKAG